MIQLCSFSCDRHTFYFVEIYEDIIYFQLIVRVLFSWCKSILIGIKYWCQNQDFKCDLKRYWLLTESLGIETPRNLASQS